MKKQPIDPWQAEDDARTLKRHAELTSDKARMSRATKVLASERKALDKALGGTGGKKKT